MRRENLSKAVSPRAEKRNFCQPFQVKTEFWQRFAKFLFTIMPLCHFYCVTFASSNKLLADTSFKKKKEEIPYDFHTFLFWPKTTYYHYFGQQLIRLSEWFDSTHSILTTVEFFKKRSCLQLLQGWCIASKVFWISWLLALWISVM